MYIWKEARSNTYIWNLPKLNIYTYQIKSWKMKIFMQIHFIYSILACRLGRLKITLFALLSLSLLCSNNPLHPNKEDGSYSIGHHTAMFGCGVCGSCALSLKATLVLFLKQFSLLNSFVGQLDSVRANPTQILANTF